VPPIDLEELQLQARLSFRERWAVANWSHWWALVLAIAALSITGYDEQYGDYTPAKAIARDGFFIDQRAAAEASGQEIKLWGFVDHGNLYGDAGAKQILEEWWAGEGPDAATWQFNLKAGADDAVGRSFEVYVPNDAERDDLLRTFVMHARARRPTKVFVKGRIYTFEAPTQISDLTGLYLEVRSSQDIRLAPSVYLSLGEHRSRTGSNRQEEEAYMSVETPVLLAFGLVTFACPVGPPKPGQRICEKPTWIVRLHPALACNAKTPRNFASFELLTRPISRFWPENSRH